MPPSREEGDDLPPRKAIHSITRYTSQFLLLAILIVVYIQIEKVIQANRAYNFFSQSMTICRPYMEERQAQMLASRFAGIQRRADYIDIIDELRRIAASNHRQLPDFEPW